MYMDTIYNVNDYNIHLIPLLVLDDSIKIWKTKLQLYWSSYEVEM